MPAQALCFPGCSGHDPGCPAARTPGARPSAVDPPPVQHDLTHLTAMWAVCERSDGTLYCNSCGATVQACGHSVTQPGCGGCDPAAVAFTRDDGGDWTPPVHCGRTYPHGPHDTTAGWCPGLDPAQVRMALALADDTEGLTLDHPALTRTGPPPIWRRTRDALRLARGILTEALETRAQALENLAAGPAPADEADRLRSGLQIIAGRGCLRNEVLDCWSFGRLADAPGGPSRACGSCVARRVLDGLPLPSILDGDDQ